MYENNLSDENIQGTPLFMQKHIVTSINALHPIEDTDFFYDPESQRSRWISCVPIWTRTTYGDSKVDAHTYNDPEPPAPSPDMKSIN